MYRSLSTNTEIGMYYDIKSFLESRESIYSYKIEKGEHQDLIVSIKMNDFSANNSEDVFNCFYNFISYKAIDIIIRDISPQRAEYMFYTSTKEGLSAKMKVIFN